jgi:2-hydroxychromene-2-carboxylate isomerase
MPSAKFYFDLVHPYCFLALPAVRAAEARGWDIEYLPW